MSLIYVGTYRKYNNGSLKGEWLDLEDYSDHDEFHAACKELHNDEDEPELMFQDWEGIPNRYITESTLDERVWEWLKLDPDQREIVETFLDDVDQYGEIEDALESFQGEHESEREWARNYWEETGMLSELPEHVQNYIDFDQFAYDARIGGDMTFVRSGGKVKAFRR